VRERVIALNERYAPVLLAGTAFLLPLKLAFTYVTLIPLLLLWIASWIARKGKIEFEPGLPEAFFVCASVFLLLAPFGVDPTRSLFEMPTLFLYGTLLFVTREVVSREGPEKFLKSLAFGICIASIGTILNALFPSSIPRPFLGQISESGQLAIVLPLFIGIALLDNWKSILTNRFLIFGTIPLALISLVCNLKRGPWAGVAITFLLLGIASRKFRVIAIAAAIVSSLILFVPDVSSRLSASEQDFFGPGGRKEMWDIAAVITQRTPLGVGFDNSRILRHYTDRIPVRLTHFHSNFINLLVESGWLGLFSFAWFFLLLLKTAIKDPRWYPYGAAIISSQIAGIVEYNFGDTKVFLMSLLVVGILAGLKSNTRASMPL